MSWYWLIAAFILGVIATLLVTGIRNDGKLKIYIPDYEDEPPYPVAEFRRPIEVLMRKRGIKLDIEVVNLDLDSQK